MRLMLGILFLLQLANSNDYIPCPFAVDFCKCFPGQDETSFDSVTCSFQQLSLNFTGPAAYFSAKQMQVQGSMAELDRQTFSMFKQIDKLALYESGQTDRPNWSLELFEHLQLVSLSLTGDVTWVPLPDAVKTIGNALESLLINWKSNDQPVNVRSGEFESFVKLKQLGILHKCGNLTMETDAFRGLDLIDLSVQVLRLNGDSSAAIGGLISLEKLSLSCSPDNDLPKGMFQRMPNLKNLVMFGMNLSDDDRLKSIFQGLSRDLKKLTLRNCMLETLPKQLLEALPALELLNLEANNINSLTKGESFPTGFDNLKYLHLFGNPVKHFDSESFADVPNMVLLQMRYVTPNLDLATFEKLANLRRLTVQFDELNVSTSSVKKVPASLVRLKFENGSLLNINKNIADLFTSGLLHLDLEDVSYDCRTSNIRWMCPLVFCRLAFNVQKAGCTDEQESLEVRLKNICHDPCDVPKTTTQSSSTKTVALTVWILFQIALCLIYVNV